MPTGRRSVAHYGVVVETAAVHEAFPDDGAAPALEAAAVLGPVTALDPRRFRDLSALGEGASGSVFRGQDLFTGRDVALKTLRAPDPERLLELKREFRVVAGIHHPNLVRLHELIVRHGQVCLTMELVPGHRNILAELASVSPDRRRALVEARFPQLAQAIHALHAGGIAHGDLKPSNCLLDDGDNVIVVDFGLSVDTRRDRANDLGGTPSYMAPERFWGNGPLALDADWYSVGAMLVEAFTGEPPIPTPSRALHHPVPTWLAGLVSSLLHRDPNERRQAAATHPLLARDSAIPDLRDAAQRETTFIGRAAELTTLESWFADGGRTGPIAITIAGEAGIGKSRLAAHFLAQHPELLVLRGHGRVSESITFPVLDAVVDDLSHHLMVDLPALPALTHDERYAVTRLFPVLGRLPALAETGVRALESHLAWRLGARALARLIAAVAERRSLVVLLEDVQWLDEPGQRLLRFLLQHVDTPRFTVLATARAAGSTPFLTDVQRNEARHELRLGPLTDKDALSLLRVLSPDLAMGQGSPVTSGSPFVLELMSELGPSDADRVAAGFDVSAAIEAKLRGLADEELRLLAVLIAGGEALDIGLVAAATGLGPRALLAAERLEHMRLGRAIPARGRTQVDVYHAATRTILRGLLPVHLLADAHRAIAQALLEGDSPNQVALALSEHLTACGERGRAAGYAVEAAAEARRALAFERHAELLALAVQLQPAPVDVALRLALADALAECGRSADAAALFQALAGERRDAPGARLEVFELERRAAEQWLRIGDVSRGIATLRRVVAASGLWYPGSQRTALLDVIRHRVVLKLAGYRYRVREPDSAAPDRLMRLDAAWSATLGLNTVDIIRSASFQARHTRLALRTGERGRLVKALATEAAYLASEGGRAAEGRAEELHHKAQQLALESGQDDLAAFVALCGGTARFYLGDWALALERLGAAETLYGRVQGANVWETINCAMYQLWACAYAGDFRRLAGALPVYVEHAEQQRNAIALAGFCSGPANIYWLVRDQPGEARRRSTAAAAPFAGVDFQSPQFVDLLAQCYADLYEGDGVEAWNRLQSRWPHINGLQFLRMQFFRIDLVFLRGLCALAARRAGADARRRDKDVHASIARLARERSQRANALGLLLAAGDAVGRQRDDAVSALVAASAALAEAGLGLHAAAAAFHTEEEAGARAWFRNQRVVAPERIARMLVPA